MGPALLTRPPGTLLLGVALVLACACRPQPDSPDADRPDWGAAVHGQDSAPRADSVPADSAADTAASPDDSVPGVDTAADTAEDTGPGDVDADGDGHGTGVDCDDADAGVHPGAGEWPPDGVDSDCDGEVDEFEGRPPDAQVSADQGGSVGHAFVVEDVTGDGVPDIVATWADYPISSGDWTDGVVLLAGGPASSFGTGVFASAHAVLEVDASLVEYGWARPVDAPALGAGVIAGLAGDDGAALLLASDVAAGGTYGGRGLSPAAWILDDAGGLANPQVYAGGDVDGDGVGDLLVASYSVYVLSGASVAAGENLTSMALASTADWRARPRLERGRHADFDGDGLSDVVLVGRSAAFPDTESGGVWLGEDIALAVAAPSARVEPQASGMSAYAMAAGGDVDGDGLADLVVASDYYDEWSFGELSLVSGARVTSGAALAASDAFASIASLGRVDIFALGDRDADGYAELGIDLYMDWPSGVLEHYVSVDGATLAAGGEVGTEGIRELYTTEGAWSTAVDVADVDGDGVDDLVASTWDPVDMWKSQWGRINIWSDPDW